jgi:hypothetical protein
MASLFGFFTSGSGIGRLTPPLRAELEPEGLLFVAEKVGAVQRFSGSVPGRHDGLGLSRHEGLLVLTRRRLYALLPSAPRLKEPLIDQPWDAPQSGAAKVSVDASGVALTIDLGRVDPRFSGDVSTTFKTTVPQDVLVALPTRALAFDVSPAYAFCLLGVRVRQ